MAKGGSKKPGLTADALLGRRSWKPLPAVTVLAGDADFLKERVLQRFARELFGDASPDVRRLRGPPNENQLGDLPLSQVLDELGTPSFFSPHRLVVVDGAGAFLAAHRDVLERRVESGFPGGHLVLSLDGKLDARTRFARAVARSGWIVRCEVPYDRPPPWETGTPVWDSPLSAWVVRHAKEKGLELDPRTAFALHDRVGADLGAIDEELEKISTYLGGPGPRRVDEETVRAVTGDRREDSLFACADRVLEARRADAARAVDRLFARGYTDASGNLVRDPPAIALPLIATLVTRLRALRRAHAMQAEGGSPEDWIREGLTQKPFIARFRRQVAANPPARIARRLDRLLEADRAIKLGRDPRRLLVLLAAEPGAPAKTGG